MTPFISMQSFQAHHEVFALQRLIKISWVGRYSLASVNGALSAMKQHPQFDPGFRRCYDLLEFTDIPLVPAILHPVLRAVMALDPVVAKRAIVAHGPTAESCRPFTEMVDPSLCRTFGEMADALEWLARD